MAEGRYVIVFADRRALGRKADECFRAWNSAKPHPRIVWAGYVESPDPDVICNGRGYAFDPDKYDSFLDLIDGFPRSIVPKLYALRLDGDGKGMLVPLGHDRLDVMASLEESRLWMETRIPSSDLPAPSNLEGAVHLSCESFPAVLELLGFLL